MLNLVYLYGRNSWRDSIDALYNLILNIMNMANMTGKS